MICERCELEHSAEVVKSMITVTELLDMLGVEVNSGRKFASPYNPDERTWSAHDFGDHFYDFSTGQGGDVIDLLRAFNPDMSYGRAVSQLCHKAVKAGREPGDVERLPVRELLDFTEQLPWRGSGDLAGWSERLGVKVPDDCSEVDGNLIIPHEDADGVYGVKVRGQDGTKTAWPGSQFTKRLYDPEGWDCLEELGSLSYEQVVICEGETDCWAVREHLPWWIYVLALPSGAGCWKDHWLEDLKPVKRIWICTDNDRAGQQARDKLTSKIGHLRAEQLRVPDLFSDAREAITAGWRPNLAR